MPALLGKVNLFMVYNVFFYICVWFLSILKILESVHQIVVVVVIVSQNGFGI